ncbi:MAG: YdeI/OmpD-associated family protein [Anaerolineae bacterium]|nr:YdeI/OmpD-associated family protein [Anaerolineae bacterium]
MSTPNEPIFFETPADFRAWLEANHDSAADLWVGFYKKGTGRPSITWPESVDQALCFGWIDGIRKSHDGDSYKIRFTPRRARSTWSAVNIARVQELGARGLMHPAGLKAFEARTDDNSGIYSHEQRGTVELEDAFIAQFKANARAWAYFQSQAAWYQKAAIHWVMSAKQETTRQRRLAQLIESSAQQDTVPPLTRRPKV